jgi:hypothetical protein
VGLLVGCWFIKHAEPLRFVVVSLLLSLWLQVCRANYSCSSSSASCPRSTASGISATISSCEK